jgi:uncharacterized membrane protein YhaH (DUF805 family)
MPQYLRAGGYVTWVLLAVGLVLLVTAVRFLLAATPRRLAFLRSLSIAYVFLMLGGVATSMTKVLYTVVREHERSGQLSVDMLLWGTGEAITSAGLGFTLLGLVWLIIAVGVRRAHDTPP